MAERKILQKVGIRRQMPTTKLQATRARVAGKEESTRTVTVACKLPNGITMQLFDWVDVPQPGPGGIRMVKESVRVGQRYIINGNRFPYGKMPDFAITDAYNGYGLTPNIPKEFWDKWLEQNKDADYVKNKLIFAHERQIDAIAEANENRKRRSGLEPIDPAKPPLRQVGTDEQTAKTLSIDAREPRPINAGISGSAAEI